MASILAVLGCSDDSQAKRARILELSGRLKHRGPAWAGLYHHGDFYLAHQRLAIVDSATGDQPRFNEDKKIVVTVNGEIYNHEQLRKLLPHHKFSMVSDCEVVAHLFEEYGEKFVDLLDGVFSFSFPPGKLYTSKKGTFHRWYNPSWFSEAIPSAPYDPLVLTRPLENAVVKRLMTDVPFRVLLSGGLDLLLVAFTTVRHFASTKAAKQWGGRLHSFSIGLEGSPDLKAAKEFAGCLGTIHHEFHFTVQVWKGFGHDVTTIRASTPMFLMARKIKSLGVKMFHKAPTKEEIKALHLYDCLRAKPRMPFLDKEFICVAISIDPEWKMIKPEGGRIDKWVLRRACDDKDHPHLPKHILYRQKKQFSDGVSYSWINGLKARTEQHVTDNMMQNAAHVFPFNTPTTKEAHCYRMIFERLFPRNPASQTVPGGASIACTTAKAVEWDAGWSDNFDPSGGPHALGVHLSADEKKLPSAA
ncbi:Asparagine synthase (glutamine-hydrolyzing) [Bertholletia excelsa]